MLALALALISAPNPVGVGNHSGLLHDRTGEVFYADLAHSGITTAMPATVPAPTVVWLGSDPTHNAMNVAQTFTATGSPAAVGVPMCPSGDFTGVDEMDGRCLTGRRFTGAEAYTGANLANPDGTDISICVARDLSSAGTLAFASNRDDTSGYGWTMYSTATATGCNLFVQTSTNNATSAAATSAGIGICCGSMHAGGNVKTYWNGSTAGTTPAFPAGSLAQTNAFTRFGASVLGTQKFVGDFYGGWIWVGSELTAAQFKSFSQWAMGIIGSRGEVATFTNTGPVGYWVDGKISVASDDWPIIGTEVPPGLTGAGSGGGGYFQHPSVTNKALYSRDISAGAWLETYATGTPWTCSQADTPFRDGRPTCLVADTDAGSSGYIYQAKTGLTLAAGQSWTACVYAKAETGTSLDAMFREETGASCTAGNYDKAAVVTDGSWKLYQFTHTVQDADCTGLRLYLSPYDTASMAGDVASTGAQRIAAVHLAQGASTCPSIICETTSAEVTCGADALKYTMTAPVVSASGTIVGTERVSAEWTPFASSTSTVASILTMYADINNRWALVAGGDWAWYAEPPGAYDMTVAETFTAGSPVVLELIVNYDRDIYQLKANGTTIDTSTTARASPAGITTLEIGSYQGNQFPSGASIKHVRITR